MMKEYYLHTDRLSVGYDGKPLIENIEIRLKRGEILTLIGPNGAGKSTILKSITKQLKLIAGTVILDGASLHEISGKELARKVAVVMTERLKTELMTCEDVVATGRYPYTGTLGILSEEDHKKVTEAMERVHAAELAEKDFSAISDGQRQRVLLARALCQEPEIIILDEPTSFLDIRHKLELLTILKEMVRKNDLAVVVSLHELDLAQKLSDQVICIHHNKIEKYGTPEEIFTDDYIRELYEMSCGSYNAEYGCLEMERAEGEPYTFVLAGNGSGVAVYRKLQRMGIPFVTGVIHTNDRDYPVARTLAARVVEAEPFEEITEEQYQQALELMKSCEKVICTLNCYGKINKRNRDLLEAARELAAEGKIQLEEESLSKA